MTGVLTKGRNLDTNRPSERTPFWALDHLRGGLEGTLRVPEKAAEWRPQEGGAGGGRGDREEHGGLGGQRAPLGTRGGRLSLHTSPNPAGVQPQERP